MRETQHDGVPEGLGILGPRAKELRDRGVCVDLDFQDRSVKAQMREANRQNARFVTVVGDDELLSGDLLVKNMASGDELQLSTDHLAEEFVAMAMV